MKDLNLKKIQPTAGYVLLEPAKAEEKTVSGIILPENESEKPQYGVVLAVGEATCCDDNCNCSCSCECGDEKETDISRMYKKSVKENWPSNDNSCVCHTPAKVGDKVIYKKWGGNEFKIGDTEYQFLKFEDILAVIK